MKKLVAFGMIHKGKVRMVITSDLARTKRERPKPKHKRKTR